MGDSSSALDWTTYSRDNYKMNYFEAMNLLDEVREGIPYPEGMINNALQLTGDIDDGAGTSPLQRLRGKRMAAALSIKEAGTWENESVCLVAENVIRS